MLPHGVRTDLHDHPDTPRIAHFSEQTVERERIRRRMRVPDQIVDPVAERSDQPESLAPAAQYRPHQVRGRRLAVGAGDPAQAERERRIPEIARGHPRERLRRAIHHQTRHARRRRRVLHDHRGGPAPDRVGDEPVPVGGSAAECHEQLASAHLSRVHRNSRDRRRARVVRERTAGRGPERVRQ